MTSIADTERQIALETQSIELGIARYRKERLGWHFSDPSGRDEADSKPGVLLVNQFIGPLAEAIDSWKTDVTTGKARRQALLIKVLRELDSDVIAMLTLRGIINSMSKGSTVQETAKRIVGPILDEINYQRLQSEEPGYTYVLQNNFKKSTSSRHRSGVTRNAMDKAQVIKLDVDPAERQRIANLLIDLTMTTTNLCQIVTEGRGPKMKRLVLKPMPEVEEWLNSVHSRCEMLSPINMPMVIKPKPWTGVKDGGYISGRIPLRIVKTRSAAFMEELSFWDMPEVYKAVNAIQETPWRINRKVLDVMRQVWDSGRTLGKLPEREGVPLPAKPHDIDTNEDALRNWKRKAAITYERNSRLVSKRISISQKIWIAEKFADEREIYFPHVLDWRGRVYPAAGVGSVNPQGDDTGKSLLEFANGKPLGETGGFWLACHLAGLFGVDKVAFEDRVKWVEEHDFELRLCAVDPMSYQFWTEADKPYQALAAIFEWDGFKTHGDAWVSHLPIAMDGSNNGAQHLSAMGRDERATVNLVPTDRPQDIYMDVAREVSLEIDRLYAEGDEMAKLWLGKITRSVAKRPVMTLCYGATKRGMANQIEEEVKKAREQGDRMIDTDEVGKACFWLANIIYPAIGRVTRSAVDIMSWLQATARVAAKNDLPVRWVTPVGFPVLQSYRKQSFIRVKSVIAGAEVKLRIGEDTEELDRRRQAAGISPNFVHSLDASHMMLTVNEMHDRGLRNFAMIHDSYGCQACDVDEMNEVIRGEFVKMYSRDILEDFRQQLIAQLPDELAEEIDQIPEKGKLNLEGVLDSEFFFA